MEFQKINSIWARKGEQSEDTKISENPRHTEDKIPRVSSHVPPPAPQIEQASSSSGLPMTENQLKRIMNSMTEDLKEYVYEIQREIIKEIHSFKEEATDLTKILQLNLDEQYVKLQCIQDEVNLIASNQNSNIIINRSDLLTIKCSMNQILEGQARDRACIEELAISLKNLLTRQRSSSFKK